MTFQELGEHIKRRREGLGLSLDELATRTKVSARMLKAIEGGDSGALPHAVYARSFVRACGREVGIPLNELDAILERLFPVQAPTAGRSEGFQPPVAAPAGTSDTPRRVAFLLVFVLLLGAVSWGGWYVASNYGNALVALISDTLGIGSSSSSSSAPAAQGNTSQPAQQAGSVEGAAGQTSGTATGSPAAPSTEPEAMGAAPADTAQAEQNDASDVVFSSKPIKVGTGMNTIDVKVYSSCWIRPQIDGARGRDYTLNTGDTFVVSYKGKAELTLSNAGGVVITHNGKTMDSSGAQGEQVTLQFSGKK